MGFYSILESFVTAIVSAVGAFVPISFLIYTHYLIRKNSYNKTRERISRAREVYQKIVDINDSVIQEVYTSAEIKNFKELLDNPKRLSHLNNSQHARLASYVNEKLKQKTEVLEKMNAMTLDMMYIDSYDFRTYLGALLDKRFPDKRFN